MKCSCIHWRCWRHWRHWLKAVVAAFYCVILVIVLPLLIWELHQQHAKAGFTAWFVAGMFVLLTIPIFLSGMVQHLLNYTQPHLQKHIIRILWMVPIYSLDSWLGLWVPSTAIYWNTARECYEAYVLYNFLRYLLNFLHSEYDLEREMDSRPRVKQPIPFCCCPPWPKGMAFLKWCTMGVLQYTIVRVCVTIIAFITQLCDVYEEGKFQLDKSYMYLAIINAISQLIAIHSLIYFYKGTRDLLKPIHPVGKFLCIKAIIFFSFWQSLVIAILVKTGFIASTWKNYDVDDVSLGLQDLLICIEMLFFAIAHYFVFSHKPFINPEAAQVPCIASCIRMLDVRDVYGDVREHFVDPIPFPKMTQLRKNFSSSSLKRQNSSEAEMLPLLKEKGASPLRECGSTGNDGVSEEYDAVGEDLGSGGATTVDETSL